MTQAFALLSKRHLELPRVQLDLVVIAQQAEGVWESLGVHMGNRPLLWLRQWDWQPGTGSGSRKLRHMSYPAGTWWKMR